MTHVTLAVLGHGDELWPFTVCVANELGLAGLPVRIGPTAGGGGVALGLRPSAGPDWKLQASAPDSVGRSVGLASDVQRRLLNWTRSAQLAAQLPPVSDGGLSTVWPDDVPRFGAGVAQTVVTLPGADVLVRGGVPTAVARKLAKALAAAVAQHLGVAGQQVIQSPLALSPADALPTPPASEPVAERIAERAVEPAPERTAARNADPIAERKTARTSPATDGAGPEEPFRQRSKRAERVREGRAGSRTYEHAPWTTSEKLLPPQPFPQPPQPTQPTIAP